jgi:hypothetical protein
MTLTRTAFDAFRHPADLSKWQAYAQAQLDRRGLTQRVDRINAKLERATGAVGPK